MREAEFLGNFPEGTDIPELLRELLEFQNQERDWYSGHFELDAFTFGKPAWFGGDRDASEQFAVFGHGPDGSLYALWLYEGRSLATAPVVFLGSEGTDCGVIANDLGDFMALLAIGSGELGFEISWGEVSEARPPAGRLREFRSWLADRFGISAPSDPSPLVRLARNNHPDLTSWLDAWQASRG